MITETVLLFKFLHQSIFSRLFVEVVTHDAISGIHDVNTQTGSVSFELCFYEADVPGLRKEALRTEINTSPPFGSVQEAVTWYRGRGYWVPLKLQDNYISNGRSCKREETLAIAEISMLSSLNGESEDDSEFWYRKPPESPLSPRGLRNVTDFSTNHSSRNDRNEVVLESRIAVEKNQKASGDAEKSTIFIIAANIHQRYNRGILRSPFVNHRITMDSGQKLDVIHSRGI
ncbi:unnamed protein product [Brassica rapa subsp. trilocularis]